MAVSVPTGIEMSAAVAVTTSVPIRSGMMPNAWPPPAGFGLQLVPVRNSRIEIDRKNTTASDRSVTKIAAVVSSVIAAHAANSPP